MGIFQSELSGPAPIAGSLFQTSREDLGICAPIMILCQSHSRWVGLSRALRSNYRFPWPKSNAVRAPAKDSSNLDNRHQRVDGKGKERMKQRGIVEIIGDSSDASLVLEENIGRVVSTDRRAQ